MPRQFIFKDTETGRELVLPVTPKGYDIEHGRKANSISMQQVGDVNLPGLPVLLDTELECLLPAQAYPFLQPGAGTNPWVYLEQLEKWSDAGTVLRFVVSGTPVNAAVLLEGVTYREQDGTNDLYADITLRQYTRPETPVLPAEPSASGAGTAASRDSATGTATAKTCTVASGDTLWGICRRYYGDGSLAWRLAAANGIANANLIRPGQVLTIPPLAQLPAAAARPPSAKIAAATMVREVKEEESGTARLVPWVPENTVKSLADLELDKIASGGGLWQSTRW